MLDVDTSRASYRLTIGDRVLTDAEKHDVFELEFQQRWNETSQLTIRFGDSHDFGLKMADLKLGNPVSLEMGWWLNHYPVFEGELVDVEPDIASDDRGFLTLIAYDKSHLLKSERKESRLIPCSNYVEALRAIMNQNQYQDLTIEIDDAASLQSKRWSDEEAKIQAPDTDFKLLKFFADRTGYYLLMKGSTLYFVKPDYFTKSQAEKWKFFARPTMQQAEQANDGLPLFRFRPHLSLVGQRTKVKVLAYVSVGPDGRHYGSAKLDVADKGARNFTYVRAEVDRVIELRVSGEFAQSVSAARDIAEAELERRSRDLVKGEGQTIGWAPLEVGQKHEIVINAFKDIGQTFTKDYLVTGVRHRLNSEGFFTEFDVSTDMVADVE